MPRSRTQAPEGDSFAARRALAEHLRAEWLRLYRCLRCVVDQGQDMQLQAIAAGLSVSTRVVIYLTD